jgi:hypothetical protein
VCDLLERIARQLEEEKIPYMVIGGQAVLLYGEPRLTRDIDITLGIDMEQWQRMVMICTQLELVPLVDDVEGFTRQTMVFPTIDRKSGFRVDWLFSFSPYEQQAMTRTKQVLIGATEVRFASIEDLVVHKLLAGRPRDIEDLIGILRKKPPIDDQYIREWLAQFDQTLSTHLLQDWAELRQK